MTVANPPLIDSTVTVTVPTKSKGETIRKMNVLAKLNFKLEPKDIIDTTRLVLEGCVKELDRIGLISIEKCTFKNVIWPLVKIENTIGTELSPINFLQYVSMDEAVRNASVEANKLIDEFQIERETRKDLFLVTKSVAENQNEMSLLDSESKRVVEKMILGFKHSGLYLGDDERALLKTKRKRLAELMVDFSKNMNEDKTELLLSASELEGCPVDFLESLEQRDNKYVLTMKYPDVFGVLRNVKDENVRRLMDVTFNNKCQGNVKLLEEAIELRRECALLLGYSNHAEYQLEDRLAKNPTLVIRFENDLRSKLIPLALKELSKLKSRKKIEMAKDTTANTVNEEEVEFYSWDYHYYSRQILEEEYAVDNEKLKEYYEIDMVVGEMLKIYEEVLSLKFVLLEDGPVWHSDVKLYKVVEATRQELVGHVYLDLFPRDGKYTHAACFSLQPGYLLDLDSKERQYPVAAMVANFSKPTTSKPSLLKHDEVVTLFHELGHAMHDMCAKVTFSRFHGTNVETDLVEAPSQMLENWCWDSQMLKRISRHYLRADESLPDSLIEQLVKAKNFNAGLLNLRQVFFGIFDMTIHSIETPLREALKGESIDGLYARLRREITLIPQPENVSPSSSFGHLMGGYDAGYYGYLWSQVFSADMFYSRFKKEGLQNPKVGLDYRYKILAPGGSRDGMELLVDFLGREPNNQAFMESLGISRDL